MPHLHNPPSPCLSILSKCNQLLQTAIAKVKDCSSIEAKVYLVTIIGSILIITTSEDFQDTNIIGRTGYGAVVGNVFFFLGKGAYSLFNKCTTYCPEDDDSHLNADIEAQFS